MIFFTADTHFGHEKIIKYCNRPFSSVEEMDEKIITNWNSVVSPKDTVWHLGDFTFARSQNDITKYRDFLNGNINLLMGNHDNQKKKTGWYNDEFLSVGEYKELKINKDMPPFILSHYPLSSWNRQRYGAIMLHGHCHGTLDHHINNRYDVGVDCCNYFPVSLDEIINGA